jgi:hypothetical protein
VVVNRKDWRWQPARLTPYGSMRRRARMRHRTPHGNRPLIPTTIIGAGPPVRQVLRGIGKPYEGVLAGVVRQQGGVGASARGPIPGPLRQPHISLNGVEFEDMSTLRRVHRVAVDIDSVDDANERGCERMAPN